MAGMPYPPTDGCSYIKINMSAYLLKIDNNKAENGDNYLGFANFPDFVIASPKNLRQRV